MANRNRRPDDEPLSDEPLVEAPGDVLGVAHVPSTGRRAPADERDLDAGDDAGQAGGHTGNEDQSHVGTRDLTEGTTGGTGPDTGGAGALRKGSGATGTDLGS